MYYARCNLKVLEGNFITWINWQSTWVFVPVGTELKMSKGKKYVYLQETTGTSYILDAGNPGDAYLEKFVTRVRPDISKFPDNIQANIRNTVARIGMTKEQAYIAMGPWGDEDTYNDLRTDHGCQPVGIQKKKLWEKHWSGI